MTQEPRAFRIQPMFSKGQGVSKARGSPEKRFSVVKGPKDPKEAPRNQRAFKGQGVYYVKI